MPTPQPDPDAFDDLLEANRQFAASFDLGGFQGVAHAGVAIVTCMDSRIDPLAMVGMRAGDAKILRSPGGRVTDQTMTGLVLGVHLLRVDRILIVPHTRCAMATDEQELRVRLSQASGEDVSWLPLGAVADQPRVLAADVAAVGSHPLIPDTVAVAGFVYDVDTGLLQPQVP
jgi:carbonic anhydrase